MISRPATFTGIDGRSRGIVVENLFVVGLSECAFAEGDAFSRIIDGDQVAGKGRGIQDAAGHVSPAEHLRDRIHEDGEVVDDDVAYAQFLDFRRVFE